MGRTRKILQLVAGLLVMVTVASGVAFAYLGVTINGIKTQDIDDQLGDRPDKVPSPEDGEPINILVIGSDTREGQGNGFGGSGYLGNQHSDTTILVHIGGNRDWATAVSIPRDTWVDMPDCTKDDGSESPGYGGKFNEAMQRAGAGCVVKTVEEITGIYVDHFVIVDFKGFKDVVNAVGGVEVCLTEPVKDKDSKLNLPAGQQTLLGQEAIAFVRARYSLGDGSDISRIRRQQDFMASLVRKIASAGTLLNPIKVVSLIQAVADSLTTDPELGTIDGMKELAFKMRDLKPSTVRFITAPHDLDSEHAGSVVLNATADELWNALRNDQQWPKPPDIGWDGKALIKSPSDIEIRVLNATGTKGLASAKAELFSALGYQIHSIDNASSKYGTETAVWAKESALKGARTVAKALGLKKVNVLPDGADAKTKILVVVGSGWSDPVSVRVKEKPASTIYGPETGRAADETDCSPV